MKILNSNVSITNSITYIIFPLSSLNLIRDILKLVLRIEWHGAAGRVPTNGGGAIMNKSFDIK